MNSDEKSWGPKESFNLLYLTVRAYAMCVLPFVRTGFGSHAFGLDALLAAALIFVSVGFFKATILLGYLSLWFVVVILQRIASAAQRSSRREYVHSQYQGDSVFGRIPGISANAARGVLEPMVTFWAGMVLSGYSLPLADFLFGAAGAMLLKAVMELEFDRARVRRMRDAHAEQTYLSRRIRNGD